MLNLIILNCDDGRKLYYSNGQRTPQGFHENIQDATLYPDGTAASHDFGMLRSTLHGQSLVRNGLIRPTWKQVTGHLTVEQFGHGEAVTSAAVRL
jgi:hypothetical protein